MTTITYDIHGRPGSGKSREAQRLFDELSDQGKVVSLSDDGATEYSNGNIADVEVRIVVHQDSGGPLSITRTPVTLPIVIGNEYQRRDGLVVVAKKPHQALCGGISYVGASEFASIRCDDHVWLSSGRVGKTGEGDRPLDLVADYLKPGCVHPAKPDAAPTAEHPMADYLHLLADGAAFQRWFDNAWHDMESNDAIRAISNGVPREELRVKPAPVVLINGREVPEPLRKMPAIGTKVFMIDLIGADRYIAFPYGTADSHKAAFVKGMLHATREAAQAHAEALLSFTTTAPTAA